jgi:hypothetical protein
MSNTWESVMGKRLLATLSVTALVAAGRGDDDNDSSSGDASSGSDVADLQLSSSDLGEILVDADGNTCAPPSSPRWPPSPL